MHFRVWLLMLVVIAANVGGNFVLDLGMRHAPPQAGVIQSIFHPVAIAGIAVLICWMLLRMRLMGLADLSFIAPVSAVGYVLTPMAGVAFLHEHVATRGWIGIVLIMLGAALTGFTEGAPAAVPLLDENDKNAAPMVAEP
jgi:uncharacterized membrane protein